MTDHTSANPPERLPDVQVKPSRAISSLWLIPIVAAMIGSWLIYKYFSELGPTINITFETAVGLEPDKTRIKYKDVDVGVVKQVEISHDLTTIQVTATLDRPMAPYINEGSRFWVVRPRVGVSGISGLTTLVSGAYIAFDPGDGEPASRFVGLEEPPVTPADAPGIHLTLVGDTPSALDVGSPVYFKLFKVGRVDSRHLDMSHDRFQYGVFINAPYDQLVNSDTRFWNVSGLDVSIGTDGVNLRSQSLEAILLGGITFDTVASGVASVPIHDGAIFTLFEDYGSIAEAEYKEKQTFVMYFEDSVRGLLPDAPVEFRGIKLGRVRDVSLVYNADLGKARLPVIVELEPERIKLVNDKDNKETKIEDEDVEGEDKEQNRDDAITTAGQALNNLVLNGMRARLETASLLTGQLYVSLDMYPDAEPATIYYDSIYPEFPTVPSQFTELTGQVNSLLTTINDLPLQQVLADLSSTLEGIDSLVNAEGTRALPEQLTQLMSELRGLGKKVNDELGKLSWSVRTTMESGRETLAGVGPDSPMYYELIRSLRELTKAAREIRVLADELQRQPESLLTGKKPQ